MVLKMLPDAVHITNKTKAKLQRVTMSCFSFSHIADVQRVGLQPCQKRTLNQRISHTFFSLVTTKKEKEM